FNANFPTLGTIKEVLTFSVPCVSTPFPAIGLYTHYFQTCRLNPNSISTKRTSLPSSNPKTQNTATTSAVAVKDSRDRTLKRLRKRTPPPAASCGNDRESKKIS